MPLYNEAHIGSFSSKPQVVFNHGLAGDGNSRLLACDLLGNQQSLLVDAAGTVVGSDANPLAISGTITAELSATDNAVLDSILQDTASLDSKTITVDTGAVVVASSALPTGAATDTLQTSMNGNLTAIAACATPGNEMSVVAASALEMKVSLRLLQFQAWMSTMFQLLLKILLHS